MHEEEWTFAKGFQRALVHSLIWSCVCLSIWIAAVLAVTPLIEMLPDDGRGAGRVRTLVTALAAVPIAWLCVRWLFERMQESAGFSSLLLTGFAVVFLWLVAFGGVFVANVIRTPEVDNGILWISLGLVGTVWTFYETFADG